MTNSVDIRPRPVSLQMHHTFTSGPQSGKIFDNIPSGESTTISRTVNKFLSTVVGVTQINPVSGSRTLVFPALCLHIPIVELFLPFPRLAALIYLT